MEIFIDTANITAIKEANAIGILDGVTTNPTLVAKEGRNYNEVLKEIAAEVDGPISAEAVSSDAEGMVKEGEEFSKIHKNIVIKIPMTKEGMKAVKILSSKNIKTNVTLIFSPSQALLAAKAGATYVSPFIGRLDDISHEGVEIIRQIRIIYDNYGFETKIIAASIRHPLHVVEVAMAGCDVATIPPDVINKLFNHPLTEKGIRKFLEDWESIPNK
ncbi:MAG: fructose-6-phosphate aldolase [Candidatus Schekmanbacteria bacterium]|nr:MAG: fructose-6-phosphate aldolase [Candidatus Schekmanbacteria bacterium]